MRVIRTNAELAEALRGTQPAFVPTMGALHDGHLALIRRAGELARVASHPAPVVVSVFVNPTQFGANEDFTRYPRMLEADTAAAANAGAEIVFAPSVGEIYPESGSTSETDTKFSLRLPAVATEPRLEDAHRPTHFAGVCQVVARLFDLLQPAFAIFGEKDYQQLLVIEAMVAQERNRWPGLQIVAHPTIREPDGLAMSSRNAYLAPSQRTSALGLKRALDAAKGQCVSDAQNVMRDVIAQHQLLVDYAVVRDALTLMPIQSDLQPRRALIAARLGRIRLIDNAAINA